MAKAQKEKAAFESSVRPREIEEKRIAFDSMKQRAKEAAAELAELEAMYAKDEFATSTKELVIDRGRKQLEFAQRRMAVEAQGFEHFEQHTLVMRMRDLQVAIDDAKRALAKAQRSRAKTVLEHELAVAKERNKRQDLAMEVAEIEKKLEAAK